MQKNVRSNIQQLLENKVEGRINVMVLRSNALLDLEKPGVTVPGVRISASSIFYMDGTVKTKLILPHGIVTITVKKFL